MKKSIRIISAIVLLILVFCISGCGKEESDQVSETKTHASLSDLIGKWKGTGNELSTITLGSDGSYKDIVDDISIIGTFTVDSTAGTLTVNESEYGMVITYSYELSEDNLTLQMNGGLPRTFTRVK